MFRFTKEGLAMSRGVRAAAITAGVVLVLVVIAGGLFTWFTRRAFPVTTGTLQVEGLKAPVEVYRDEYGVAHIYASSPEDLFFAQGYVHAQERFWQMEFERRVGSGRLSEIFGSGALETDTYLRTFGFRALAEEAYAGFDPDTKLVLESYADGVNAYVSGRQPAQLGLEFALLDLQGVRWEIEPWTPVDSLVWGYMMVYDQSDKLRTELRNADLLLAAGEQGYAEIVPPYRDDRPTIVQDDGLAALGLPPIGASTALGISELAYLREVNQAMSASPALAQLTTFGFGGVGASNSFVIAGQHTETGSPILANDPHMSQQMPSLWYEVGMHCIEKTDTCPYEFRGNSLPGVPGILIGHNDRIAWGLTNANFDAQDVYIERINPQNPNQ
ncbi:MAG: penicillin acylase family protein, partial [Anaerolineae bacterium]|nr:penicillin acylase family protein [Anaerolineae bacterium]